MVKLIIKNILNRKWSFLVTIFINIVALSMISMSVYIYENTTYCETVIDKTMRYDTDNMGIIALNDTEIEEGYAYDDYFEIGKSIVSELMEKDKIISAGGYDICGPAFDDSDIALFQHELLGDDEEGLNYYSMDAGIIDMFNIEFTEGEMDKSLDTSDEFTEYLYLGEGYREKYKVGDVVEWSAGKDIHLKMIVKGFFSENGRVVDPNIISTRGSFTTDKCYINLKASDVIMVRNTAKDGAVCFVIWDEEYSYDEIQDEINSVSAKYGKAAHLVKLSEIIDEKVQAGNEISGYIMDVLWIILVTAIIMVTCIQITNILNNTSQYGIMYANGFSTGNIMAMLVVETFLNTVISGALSIVFVKKLISFIFLSVKDESEVIDYIFKEYVIGADMLSAFIISIIAIAVPMIIIYRMKPVQLIGGEDT